MGVEGRTTRRRTWSLLGVWQVSVEQERRLSEDGTIGPWRNAWIVVEAPNRMTASRAGALRSAQKRAILTAERWNEEAEGEREPPPF